MGNPRFSEYVTSGAFHLSLSRHQVSAIGMMVGAGASPFSGAALERKGLAEAVSKPSFGGDDGYEFRLTNAGLICARLLCEAGLSNGPEDPAAVELAAMRGELVETREQINDLRQRLTSAMARKAEVEQELAAAQRRLVDQSGCYPRLREEFRRQDPYRVEVRLKDPLPHLTDEEVLSGAPTRHAETPAKPSGMTKSPSSPSQEEG